MQCNVMQCNVCLYLYTYVYVRIHAWRQNYPCMQDALNRWDASSAAAWQDVSDHAKRGGRLPNQGFVTIPAVPRKRTGVSLTFGTWEFRNFRAKPRAITGGE